MRILYVDTDGVWRGGQEQLFSLMSGMKGRGHDVSLAAPPDSPLAEKAKQVGISTYSFAQRSEFSPRALWRMLAILRAGPFEIVHFNTPRPLFIGALASVIGGVPARVCSRRVNFPLRSRFSRLKYNRMQGAVVTVSVSIRQTLIEGGVDPDLITVIYEGVDLEWIDCQIAPPLLSNSGGLLVGTVAHLSPEKGYTTLLEAAQRLTQRFPNVTYVLVGAGELESELKEQARELIQQRRVIFAGFRPDTEGLMKQFDVFCLPSVSEGLSSAILAAMANRLPVVATKVGGIPELVIDGETGFLVPPNQPERLMDSLARLLASAELREQMGRAGRRRVETCFTLDRKLDETEKLYLGLLRSARIR